ncbi:MAG TPA: tetratricopeptide repeat protein, partial [Steroidobacteraceae bacterium]|nr:tetratricopeptide repeat protein [Steroidobacteraceae bacterium]
LGGAFESMQRYMDYSRELARRAPDNDAYLLELSYAYSNLGSVALAQGRPEVALEEFRRSVALAGLLATKSPDDYDLAFNLADTRSWIGTTLLELGRLADARDEFAMAVQAMRPFHVKAQDQRASYNYCRLLILQADADINRGNVAEAKRALGESLAVYRTLLENDPTNTTWRYNALTAETVLLGLIPPGEWTAQERASLQRIESTLGGASSADASDKDYIRLEFRVRNLRDIVLLHQGEPQASLRAARQTHRDWQAARRGKTMIPEFTLIEARVEETLGSALAAAGDLTGARAVWQAEVERLDDKPTTNLSLAAVRRLLAIDLGDAARADAIAAQLEAAGYRDPRSDPAYTRSGAYR